MLTMMHDDVHVAHDMCVDHYGGMVSMLLRIMCVDHDVV